MLIQEKVRQAIDILNEFGIDSWITFVRESAINGDPALEFLVDADLTWHSALIINRSGETSAIVGEYDRRTVEELGAYREVIGYVKGVNEPFQRVMKKLNPARIAVNFSRESEICDGITHGMYLTLVDLLSELGLDDRIVPADQVVSALRQRKTKTELEFMKRAIVATEEIFAAVSGFIAPGKTELDIASFMKAEVERRKLDYAWEPKVCPAVFAGPDTAAAHYAPTSRVVERGQILNMDFGVRVGGYCSDLQRTFYILDRGETKAPPDVQRGFDTILHSVEASRKAMRPGVKGNDIDAVARGIVTGAGYDEFPHALGHQVGRFAHDGTALLGPAWEKYARKPFYALEEGMVFTIEPRLTVRDRGIATIEEMVVVTKAGAEYLSTPQKALLLIGTGE
jgi:Xaa-Pro aminopeptidase